MAPTLRYIDLFCGLGAFRLAMTQACAELGYENECVFSSDIDPYCQTIYEANFNERPFGDITKVNEKSIPDHDLLFGGFPCQPFSIYGHGKGFADIRGTLFFDIARILEHKRPQAFMLENVKRLVGHDGGATLRVILEKLRELGYENAQHKVLNALDYGLPQKRERVIIVGSLEPMDFHFPEPLGAYAPLESILETDVDPKHLASATIVASRKAKHRSPYPVAIWHENKSKNITSYPYSCALRAGSSYNYLLVNGERRLTPREMFRLQGFPDAYKIVVSDHQARKQAGNSAPVNLLKAAMLQLLPTVVKNKYEQSGS